MTTLTAAPELVETRDDDARPPYEIVDGVEVEKPMSLLSQMVGFKLGTRVEMHLLSGEADGYASTEPRVVCFDWDPGLRRIPDFAYWRRDQYPDGIPPRGDATVAPAWVVEVVSPGDEIEYYDLKVADYFRAGVELVWTVHPATRTVHTQRPDGTARVYRAADAITADPVLPGFSARVGDFFPA